MKTEEFRRLLTEIDDKYIESVGEELEEFRGYKYGRAVKIKASREFNWKQIVGAAVCTAAAFVGAFVLALNIGVISINNSAAGSYNSEGAGSDADSSGEHNTKYNYNYGIYLDKDYSGELTVDYAYAYYLSSDVPTRYEVGSKFGEIAEISSAKSTFLVTDGKPVLLRQEITLKFIYGNRVSGRDLMSDAWFDKLELPSFGEDFTIMPLMYFSSNDIVNAANGRPNADNWYSVNCLSFVVDHVEKTLAPQSDDEINKFSGGGSN